MTETGQINMDTFENNKIFSEVLAKYLNDRFGSDYVSTNPDQYTDNDRPKSDIDSVLSSDARPPLFLQLKEVRDHNHTLSKRTKSGKEQVFTSTLSDTLHPLLEKNIKKWEEKYNKNGNEASKLILILHLRNGYLISDDAARLTGNFDNNTFKGIYVVSPEIKFVGGQINKEFVTPIKDISLLI